MRVLSEERSTVTDMLNDHDRALLAMERRTFRHTGSKATAVRAELHLSMNNYQQQVLALIQRPEALEADPVLVNRLCRLQETRRRRAGRAV